MGHQASGKIADGGDRAAGVGDGDVAPGATAGALAANGNASIHRWGAGGACELGIDGAAPKPAATTDGLRKQAVGVVAVNHAIKECARGDAAAVGDRHAARIGAAASIATHHSVGVDGWRAA